MDDKITEIPEVPAPIVKQVKDVLTRYLQSQAEIVEALMDVFTRILALEKAEEYSLKRSRNP